MKNVIIDINKKVKIKHLIYIKGECNDEKLSMN